MKTSDNIWKHLKTSENIFRTSENIYHHIENKWEPIIVTFKPIVHFEEDFNTRTEMLDRVGGGWVDGCLSQTRPIPRSTDIEHPVTSHKYVSLCICNYNTAVRKKIMLVLQASLHPHCACLSRLLPSRHNQVLTTICVRSCIWVILRCWGNSSILCQQNSDAL